MRPTLGVSTAVFRDGRVLLAQRGTGALRGLWSLPGGRVEPGERLADAALRELMEEVGVSAEIADIAGIVEILPKATHGHFVVVSFAARWTHGEPQPGEEAQAVCWADPETLDGLDVTEDLHRITRRARELVGP